MSVGRCSLFLASRYFVLLSHIEVLAGVSKLSTLEKTNICIIKYTQTNQIHIYNVQEFRTAAMEHFQVKNARFHLPNRAEGLLIVCAVSYVNGTLIIYRPGGQK